MKLIILSLATLLATNVFAASVNSAKLDEKKENILIDVSYGGGCGEHEFSLQIGGCLETSPVRCTADLIEKTTDACEAMISTTVAIPLVKYGLNDPYYQKASLTINGSDGSKATVKLP